MQGASSEKVFLIFKLKTSLSIAGELLKTVRQEWTGKWSLLDGYWTQLRGRDRPSWLVNVDDLSRVSSVVFKVFDFVP
jgi:hypothetical protein